MATKVWSAVIDGNWSLGLNWSGGTVPATTDAIVFDNTSTVNCTIDALGSWSGGAFTIQNNYGGNITLGAVALVCADFSMASGTWASNAAATMSVASFTIADATFAQPATGTFTCTGGITLSINGVWSNPTVGVTLSGASAAAIELGTTAFTNCTLNKTGTCTLTGTTDLSILHTSAATTLTVETGCTIRTTATWAHTGNVTMNSGSAASGFAAINVTEGSLNVNSGSTWPSGVNVTLTLTGATARTLTGGGKTCGNFNRTGSGTGITVIAGSNTFNDLKDNDGTAAHTLRFTATTPQTVASFHVSGISGKVVTIDTQTGGSAATIHKSTGGSVSCDYLSIKDSTVDASPVWYAGANSTEVSGDTNWIFTAAPASGEGVSTMRRRRRR